MDVINQKIPKKKEKKLRKVSEILNKEKKMWPKTNKYIQRILLMLSRNFFFLFLSTWHLVNFSFFPLPNSLMTSDDDDDYGVKFFFQL